MAFVSIKRYLLNQVLNFASYSHYPGSYVSRVTASAAESSGGASGSYRRDSRSRSRSPITDDYNRDDRRRHRRRQDDSDSGDDEYQPRGSSKHEKRNSKRISKAFAQCWTDIPNSCLFAISEDDVCAPPPPRISKVAVAFGRPGTVAKVRIT